MQRHFALASRTYSPTVLRGFGGLLVCHIFARLHVGLDQVGTIVPIIYLQRGEQLAQELGHHFRSLIVTAPIALKLKDMLASHMQDCRLPLLSLSLLVAVFLRSG